MEMIAILEELINSSSSDDDDEMFLVLQHYLPKKRLKRGSASLTADEFDDETFRERFRLTKPSFQNLVHLFSSSPYVPKHTGRENVSSERHILIFLRFAGTKQGCRIVADEFDVSPSTFHIVFTRVMMFLFDLSPKYIQLPTTPEMKDRIAHRFQSITGFPNVIGCIGCSRIPLHTGRINKEHDQANHPTALTLQGVCDSQSRFIDVVTGFHTEMHDAQVLKASFIYPKLATLCGPDDTYHLLGDAAYPISPRLLTPFKQTGNLTPAQSRYNAAFSKTRMTIDNAFRLMKARFRQLACRLNFRTVERACYFIVACCVLHNMCIDWDEKDFELDEEMDETIRQDFAPSNEDSDNGKEKRNHIAMNCQFT